MESRSLFTAAFFKGNRERLKTLFAGSAPIVITAHGLMQKASDETYPFKQDGNFWYLTGCNDPNVVLVMDKSLEYLIVPEMDMVRVAFDGNLDVGRLERVSGITEIMNETAGWKRLGSRLKRIKNVATMAPAATYVDFWGMYTNPARGRLIQQMKSHNSELKVIDLRKHLQSMRMVKQKPEIKAIKFAIAATLRALNEVEQKFQKQQYQYEFEVEMDLTKYFWQGKCEGHAFEPIVASCKRSATIHAVGSTGPISYDSPLLLDVGAAYQHYAADISRTYMSAPTARFNTIYDAVQDVANYARLALKPGVLMREYEKEIEKYMGEKLRVLGLIKTIDHEAVRRYFPHATSHFLGIDVHDLGDYELPLVAGVVLTVEPGIYIPEEGIGVRIEDDVLITASGNNMLSQG